jgi:hypothetical protein
MLTERVHVSASHDRHCDHHPPHREPHAGQPHGWGLKGVWWKAPLIGEALPREAHGLSFEPTREQAANQGEGHLWQNEHDHVDG